MDLQLTNAVYGMLDTTTTEQVIVILDINELL